MSKSALNEDDDSEIFAGQNKESILLDDKDDEQYFHALDNSNHLQHQQHSQNVSKILHSNLDQSDITGKDIGNMIEEKLKEDEGQIDAEDDEAGDEEAPLIAPDKEEDNGSRTSWNFNAPAVPDDAA